MRLTHPAVLVAGGVLGVVVVGGGITYLVNGAAVPKGTTVAGIDVGGRSRSDASAALRAGVEARTARPVQLVANATTVSLDPAAATLGVDVDRTIDRAAGGGPFSRFAGLFGRGHSVTPVSTADEAKLAEAITAASATVGKPAIEGGVLYKGVTPTAVLPAAGTGVQVGAAAPLVRDRWLSGDPIVVPFGPVQPTVSADVVQATVAGPATQAVSGLVTLSSAGAVLELTPADLAATLQFVAVDGKLVEQVDGAALLARLGDRVGALQNAPVNAAFTVDGSTVTLVPSRDGRTVDAAALQKGVLAALAAPNRSAELELQTAKPAFTTEQAQALGIKEQISTFTTNHPCCAARVTNIHRIADLVQGTIVQPGQTFSLNGAVGERTVAKGFVAAPQIQDGEFIDGVGGGISQFTTTMYNAAFFSGMVDVEHTPHSYYISRYPEGREATITYPSPDLKWRNDSPTAVLVHTSYTGTSVTVTFFGTKLYDEVLSQSSGRSRITQSPVSHLPPGPTCKSQSGTTGFDVTITRVMKRGGAVIATTTATNRYKPEPTIICDAPVVTPVVPPVVPTP